MKIVIGVNTLTSLDQAAYTNHCQFWYRLGKQHPDWEFILSHPRRMSIDIMRNMTAKVALDSNADYLMFIDDDVLVPLDALEQLMATDADIAAGWTIIRGYPYKNMFFVFNNPEKTSLSNWAGDEDIKDENGEIIKKGITSGIVPCDAVGFSCVLIKVDLLKRIEPPFFVTGPFNTEDVYFCIKASQMDPDVKIVVNLDVMTSHNLGSDYIDPLTKKYRKAYHEALMPQLLTAVEPPHESKPIEWKDKNPLTYAGEIKKHVFGVNDEPNNE